MFSDDTGDDNFVEEAAERALTKGELALNVLLDITASELYTEDQLTNIGHKLGDLLGCTPPSHAAEN